MNRREALIPLTIVLVMSAIALATAQQPAESWPRETPSDVEEIYVFRSFGERTEAGETEFCKREAPFRGTSHNYYSLWRWPETNAQAN